MNLEAQPSKGFHKQEALCSLVCFQGAVGQVWCLCTEPSQLFSPRLHCVLG